MPISGVVISCRPENTRKVLVELGRYDQVEVHGSDDSGNIVAVLDTVTSEEMEKLINTMNKHEQVLGVGLTYLNTEDEAERMAAGEETARPFGFRKPLKEAIELD